MATLRALNREAQAQPKSMEAAILSHAGPPHPSPLPAMTRRAEHRGSARLSRDRRYFRPIRRVGRRWRFSTYLLCCGVCFTARDSRVFIVLWGVLHCPGQQGTQERHSSCCPAIAQPSTHDTLLSTILVNHSIGKPTHTSPPHLCP